MTSTVGFSQQRLQRVSHWLQQQTTMGRLAGASVLVGRGGQHAFFTSAGYADVDNKRVFDRDTIVRLYSMTKSVTSVAAMMLYEKGCFQLDDPVAAYLPEFADVAVWLGGEASLEDTQPLQTPMTIAHLLTHTAGLTYGFMQANVVDEQYRHREIEFPNTSGNLAELVSRLAKIPLICQPGSQWNYSVASDVVGRLVEVWSGRTLAEYFDEHIFEPLGMLDTGFFVKPQLHGRFASLYAPKIGGGMQNVANTTTNAQTKPSGYKLQEAADASHYLTPVSLYSGGGGLTGSIDDYGKFCQMLLNLGELGGERLLGRKTVEYMRVNHLPGGQDMAGMGQPVWSETSYDGIGFGLGFAVVLDPVKAQIITSPGEHHWGGAASTFFWIDPLEDMYVVFFTQLIPSSTYPIRRELRTRVYQALIS